MKRRLNDKAIKAARPNENGKPKKHADGGGLYLLVKWVQALKHDPNNNELTISRYWRYKYNFAGKEKLLPIGKYPEVSLGDARKVHDGARELHAKGIDPMEHKKHLESLKLQLMENSFEAVAREWFVGHSVNWTEGHAGRVITRLENDVFPWLGKMPISTLEPPDILKCLRRVEGRGALETAHRVKQTIGQVFRFAVATGKAKRDQTADLKGALPPVKQKHLAAIIEPKLIGELLRGCWAYKGDYTVQSALKLSAYLFARPGEVRRMEWTEIDFDKCRWMIPAEKMKTRAAHIVPLPKQAIEILEDIKPLTGRHQFVFPGVRSRSRPMSDNTVNQAIRRLGYDNSQMTAHGFRAMASTTLYELGYSSDLIERQLAHVVGNDVRRAYDRSENLPERKAMMKRYADYLDGLRIGADIIPINSTVNGTLNS